MRFCILLFFLLTIRSDADLLEGVLSQKQKTPNRVPYKNNRTMKSKGSVEDPVEESSQPINDKCQVKQSKMRAAAASFIPSARSQQVTQQMMSNGQLGMGAQMSFQQVPVVPVMPGFENNMNYYGSYCVNTYPPPIAIPMNVPFSAVT